MKDLRVLPHLCEVRVDDVDDEPVLGELGEAMTPRNGESFPGRNRPRKKTHEIARYGAGTIRASKNFCNRRKVSSLGGVGGGVQGSQEGARRGQEGGSRQGASWPPWSSSPAPLGLGIFLILQKL